MKSIIWTESARKSLLKASIYYAKHSQQSARELRKRIFDKVRLLSKNPLMGPEQEFPVRRKFEYHYLIERTYKILYRVDGDTIYIVLIFDTRQSPEKLAKLLSE